MILVDTSTLINYLKGGATLGVRLFDEILDKSIPYGINEFIYQEILQGSKTVSEFEKLKEYLNTIPFYCLREGKASFEKAAYLNLSCRKSGITIRSTIDFLIAQTAIENDLYLLHDDDDFNKIARVVPELKIYRLGKQGGRK
jgi:predicted nucleic acid-binding protein